MRASRSPLATALVLSLLLLASGALPARHVKARAGATIPTVSAAADPCRIAPSAVLDPLGAYFASLDRAEMQFYNGGDTSCILDLTTGAERTGTLSALSAARQRHPTLALQAHTVVATGDFASQGSAGVPDCSAPRVTVLQDISYRRGQDAGAATVRFGAPGFYRYLLRDSATTPDGQTTGQPHYVALDDSPARPGALPGAAGGAFAASLSGSVNRYLADSATPNNSGGFRVSMVGAVAQTGFVVDAQSASENFFGVQGLQEGSGETYYNNIQQSVPSLVTVDAGLHTFHVLFDRTLLTAESTTLGPRLRALLVELLEASAAQRGALTAPDAVAANEQNAAYLAVALRVLGGAAPLGSLPASQTPTVDREVALVQGHQGSALSPFLGLAFDYRLFAPRGHYNDGPELQSYFEAQNWLALVQAPLEAPANATPVQRAAARAGALRAVLMAALMQQPVADQTGLARWHGLSDPITVLIGTPAGPALPDIIALMGRVYGTTAPAVAALQDPARLARFLALVPTLPAPPYRSTSSTGQVKLRGFGLFPARGTADGGLAAALTYPNVTGPSGPRTLPSGLDVLAALGSTRAAQLAAQAGPWPTYNAALSRAVPAFNQALTAPSLYAHWLGALRPLAQPMPTAAPPAMRTAAWADKELLTGLASWSELRHDTILYTSQFGGLGGGGVCTITLFRDGYVEPIPAAWTNLAGLADLLAAVTRSQGLFDGLTPKDRTVLLTADDTYRAGLRALGAIAADELSGQPLTVAQRVLANHPYPALGQPMSAFFTRTPHPKQTPDQTQAAEIADVATDLQTGRVLEVGEGRVRDMWVLVPIDGYTWLARGQVYTYYEFTTAGQRLTDQRWQQRFAQNGPGPNPSMPTRVPGQKGRPRLVGPRLPTLAARLADPTTAWTPLTVPFWYGETDRTIEIVSDTAVWYSTGLPPVPVRWALIRDPADAFPPQALLCTDRDASPVQIVSWVVLRWRLETTFHEVRDHLGVETGRGWSETTIRRTTPALLGLLSFVTLVAHDHGGRGTPLVKGAAWYHKREPTFTDAIAVVRRSVWTHETVQTSSSADDLRKVPRALVDHLCELLCSAA